MQNKTTLQTPNEILTANEPWHRGSGFTWMLLALAGLVFFFSGAVAKAANGYWDLTVGFNGGSTTAASNANLGNQSSLTLTKAGFNAWSDNGMWWNNSYIVYRVTGQDKGTPGYLSWNAPRTGGSGNNHYFGWNDNPNIDLMSGLTYRGTYGFNYFFEYRDNGGITPTTSYTQNFTKTTGDYYAEWNSGTGNQADFNGGAASLSGANNLVKVGAGQINLTGDNSHTGTTTINAGALEVQHNGGLGTTAGSTTVNNGGQLRFYTSGAGLSVAEDINVTGAANNAILSTGGVNQITGTVTLNGNTRIGANTSGGAGSLALGDVSGGNNVLYLGADGANLAISGNLSGAGNSQDGTTTSLFKDGGNSLTLSGNNTYTGDTRISQGSITVASGGNLGSGSDVFLAKDTSLTINTDTTVASVREWGETNAGTMSIASGARLTVNGSNRGTNYMNSISGAGGLTMSGSGSELNLYGTQGYTGKTTVTAGTLATQVALASTDLEASGGTLESKGADKFADGATITVSGGTLKTGGNDTITRLNATSGTVNLTGDTLTVTGTGGNASSIGSGAEMVGGTIAIGTASANSGTLTVNSLDADNSSALSIASGGTLTGTFRTSGALSVDGTLAPGNSTGISYAGATTFLGGGRYQWEIDTFGPGAVVGTNWDFLDISGALTISASSGDKFWIDIVSLLASTDTAGAATGFNLTSNYSFAIATAAGGISGFDAGAFGINTDGFQNSMGASPAYAPGVWSVSTSGNSLMLNYAAATAIPEPSSASMLVLGLAAVLAKRRRVARG